jgi:hypothetical protein
LNLSAHLVGPLAIEAVDVLEFLDRLLHLFKDDLMFVESLGVVLAGACFLECACFVVKLCEVEAGGCFVSDHDVPLKEVGFDFLHVGEHAVLRIGFALEGSDDVLQLLLVFFLDFG